MKTVQTNFRVVIDPRRLGDYGFMSMSDGNDMEQNAKDYHERCEEIVEQINRHVDNVGGVGIESDAICAYCYTEVADATDENGIPACCDKAVQEYEAEVTTAATSDREASDV